MQLGAYGQAYFMVDSRDMGGSGEWICLSTRGLVGWMAALLSCSALLQSNQDCIACCQLVETTVGLRRQVLPWLDLCVSEDL